MNINELEFNFLNKVIKDSKGNPVLGQLLVTKALHKKVISKIYNMQELKDLYEKSKTNKNLFIDFSFSDNFLKCDNIPSIQISDNDIEALHGIESVNAPVLTSIYDLFEVLVENKAFLVGEDIVKDGMNMTDAGIAKFLPVYSQSTMTVHIPLRIEDKWKTIKLIYADNGTLRTGKFMFAIPKSKESLLEPFPVIRLHEEEFNNLTYVVYTYEVGLLTLAYNMDDVQIFPSIINRYTFMSELYKQLIRTCNLLSMYLTEATYGETPKNEFNVDRKNNISRYTDGYVIISLRYKQLTKKEIGGLIKDCLTQVVPKIRKKEMDMEGLRDYICSLNLTTINRLVYMSLCQILVNGGDNPLDRLEYTIRQEHNYKYLKFKVDTILYMLRANLFVVPVRLTDGDYQILVGSDVPYTSLIERRKQ